MADLLDKMFDKVERWHKKMPAAQIACKLGLTSAPSDRSVHRWVRESDRLGWLEITAPRFGIASETFLVTRYDRNAKVTRAATLKVFVA